MEPLSGLEMLGGSETPSDDDNGDVVMHDENNFIPSR